jgi:hypothetical protein
MAELSCGRFHEQAAELALGVLPGRDRAEALAHLNECPECVEHLRSLTEIGDGLLELAPGVEPPVGFEDRVMHRLGFAKRRSRRTGWPRIALAAAVAAVVFGLGGWAVGSQTQSSPPSSAPATAQPVLRVASLVGPTHQRVGEAFAYVLPGHPPWLYMAVNTGGVSGPVSCDLQRADGQLVPVGSFWLTAGYGSWGVAIPFDPSAVVGARLVSDHGVVLASGTFVT